MFSPEHEIWKFSLAGDELDDWLPYAEDLVKKWANQDSDDIILVSLLLMDDLLPSSAKKAFAQLTFKIIAELEEKKVAIKCLHIEQSRPGRKDNRQFKGYVILSVRNHIQNGLSKTEAYKLMGTELSKYPETIRRIYERALKGR